MSNNEWYTEVTDNDGHRYIIPAERLAAWYTWLGLPEEDVNAVYPPFPVDEIGGKRILFRWDGIKLV